MTAPSPRRSSTATGNSAELAHLADVLATVVARVGYRRGGLVALLAAADLIHDQ